MPKRIPTPGMVVVSPGVVRKLRVLVDQIGRSGASRRLDIPIRTIRRVIAGEQVRPATALMVETRLWERGV